MITGRLNMVLGLVAMIQAAINGKLLGEPARVDHSAWQKQVPAPRIYL